MRETPQDLLPVLLGLMEIWHSHFSKISSLTLCTSSAPKWPEYLSDISLALKAFLRKEKIIEAEKTFKTKLPFLFQNGLKVDAVFSGYCFLLYPQMCGIKHPFNRVQYDKTKVFFFLDYCSGQ